MISYRTCVVFFVAISWTFWLMLGISLGREASDRQEKALDFSAMALQRAVARQDPAMQEASHAGPVAVSASGGADRSVSEELPAGG